MVSTDGGTAVHTPNGPPRVRAGHSPQRPHSECLSACVAPVEGTPKGMDCFVKGQPLVGTTQGRVLGWGQAWDSWRARQGWEVVLACPASVVSCSLRENSPSRGQVGNVRKLRSQSGPTRRCGFYLSLKMPMPVPPATGVVKSNANREPVQRAEQFEEQGTIQAHHQAYKLLPEAEGASPAKGHRQM